MAAKVDRVDQAYWDEVVKPLVDSHPNVEFVGEINERQKAKFIGEASALIFPIDWPEPFGLVMIEAMACGTPVIAFRSGSTPEVVDDGVTGFLVDDVEAAAAAVARVTKLNRAKVRARFDERFAIERVAEDYLNIYGALPGVRRSDPPHRGAPPGAARPPRSRCLTASRLRFRDCSGLGRRRRHRPTEAQFIVSTSIAAGSVEHIDDEPAVGAPHRQRQPCPRAGLSPVSVISLRKPGSTGLRNTMRLASDFEA